jgi:hypothetical protein
MAYQERVGMRFIMTLGKTAMADVMYAIIMTDSRMVHLLGINLSQYTRKQNTYNRVWMMCEIPGNKLQEFETIAKVKLVEPEKQNKTLRSNQNEKRIER